MQKKLKKLLGCYRGQCALGSRKPCWLRKPSLLADGINIHGYFLSEIGLGESARLMYASVRSQGIKVNAHNRKLEGRQNDMEFSKLLSDSAPFKFSLSIDGLLGVKGITQEICHQKTNIIYPFWELDKIRTDYIGYLNKFDKVWAASSFIFDTLIESGVNNVGLVKHPLFIPQTPPSFIMSKNKLEILFFLDFDSFSARKNPEAAVAAFKKAFGKNDDVHLTIKTRGHSDAGRRAWLSDQARNDRRIDIIDKLLSRKEMIQLIDAHDVFLSLHRSEGLGLGCAEALIAGKVVVATDYGGSRDFINDATGYPVEWKRVDVKQGEYAHPENATWADPSIDHAAALLRSIYDSPQAATTKAKQGYSHIVDNHSPETIGKKIKSLLQI